MAWPQSLWSAIRRWLLKRRISRHSKEITQEIYPSLWENVRRKVATASAEDLAAYASVRAAQLAQERVDSIMSAEPSLSAEFATSLLLQSTERATKLVLGTAATVLRSAA